MADLYKYGVAVHLYKPLIKRAVIDLAVSADWTPAAGDVKISKDGAAAANVTNLPTAITMGNTAMWDFSLTATEMQAAKIRITVSDSATKAVEDNFFEIDTYGNASAQHAVDLTDGVRMGLTSLPNAAAEAAGGLYTRGTGAGQVNQAVNGTLDANTKAVRGRTLLMGTVNNAAFTPTATEFESNDVTEATASHYLGRSVYPLTGNLVDQCVGVITVYTLQSGRGHFTVSGSPSGEAMANGDTFLVI